MWMQVGKQGIGASRFAMMAGGVAESTCDGRNGGHRDGPFSRTTEQSDDTMRNST